MLDIAHAYTTVQTLVNTTKSCHCVIFKCDDSPWNAVYLPLRKNAKGQHCTPPIYFVASKMCTLSIQTAFTQNVHFKQHFPHAQCKRTAMQDIDHVPLMMHIDKITGTWHVHFKPSNFMSVIWLKLHQSIMNQLNCSPILLAMFHSPVWWPNKLFNTKSSSNLVYKVNYTPWGIRIKL